MALSPVQQNVLKEIYEDCHTIGTVAVIDGPPGSGKSTIIRELVLKLNSDRTTDSKKVLILSRTYSDADAMANNLRHISNQIDDIGKTNAFNFFLFILIKDCIHIVFIILDMYTFITYFI